MTRCSLPSDEVLRYESSVRKDSACYPGVSYSIHRMSFGRRSELLHEIRRIGARMEYLEAGQELKDRIEASLTGSEIDAAYFRWGLREVEGLEIDGETPTPDVLLACGPEALVREILASIKAECTLGPDEAKN